MDLPLELRFEIYKHSLVDGAEIIAHPAWFETPTDFSEAGVNRPAVALLRTNRQINEEAAIVWYGQNLWRIPNEEGLDPELNFYRRHGTLFRRGAISFSRHDEGPVGGYDVERMLRDSDRTFEAITLHKILKQTTAILRKDVLLKECMANTRSVELSFSGLYCPVTHRRDSFVRQILLDILATKVVRFDNNNKDLTKTLLGLRPKEWRLAQDRLVVGKVV